MVDSTVFAEEHETWRVQREGRAVTPPGGPVLWIGLWQLSEGANPFGADPGLPIVLGGQNVPPVVGTLYREGALVELEPAPGVDIRLHEGPAVAERMELRNDRDDEPTRLAVGSLGLRIHAEPGTDRLWLRAWDEAHPERESVRLPDYCPVAPEWRVRARFEPYDEPEMLRLPDVTGGTVEFRATGELVFERDGRRHRIIATAGETSSSFFVMLWDSTATATTYRAGRYLRVPFPEDDGWTTIDFNRTYNAPCAFTAYSVCALPPRENWLELWVEAGEMRPDKLPEVATQGG